MKLRSLPAVLVLGPALLAQTNSGELRLHVDDASGHSITQADVRLRSAANQLALSLKTDAAGNLELAHLPYGIYRVEIVSGGFASFTAAIVINSPIPAVHDITLQIAPVQQTLAVTDSALNPEHAGNVNEVGPADIQNRLSIGLRDGIRWLRCGP